MTHDHSGHADHVHGEGHGDDHQHDHGHNGHGHDHGDLFSALLDHLGPVLDNAAEGVYVWLDEEHTACNGHMADLLGVTPEEWSATTDFLGTFVDEADRERFGENYAKAIGHLQGPVRFRFKAIRGDGGKVELETDMIPLTFEGHAVAYHFVRKAR